MTTKTGKKSAWKKDDLLTAYLVLLPSFLLLVTFVIAPLVISVVNSFYDSSAYMDAMWKGMGNYTKVLTDEKFWKSIGVGLKFILSIVPIQLILAFFIAHLVIQLPKHLSSFVKVTVYMPCLLSGIIVGAIFSYIYASDAGGFLNNLLSKFGVAPIGWTGEPRWALFSVAVAAIWNGLGYTTLVMLGGILDIPREMLPEVRSSGEVYGTANVGGMAVPIAGIAGDQQAALFGQGCFEKGEAKNTYGTGCFLLMNTGYERPVSKNGLLTTVAATLRGERPKYALEGSVFIGGAVIQWLRDELRFFTESRDAEYYARKVPDTGGVYIVPAFTGMGAPYWDMYARGTIVGITRGTKREHLIRAALESIAYQSADLVAAMEKDTGVELKALKADGGASRDGFLMQFQSDILGKEVLRPAVHETTALGAASLAGLSVGVWKDEREIEKLRKTESSYFPAMEKREREEKLKRWHRAVERSLGWELP
ncbi:MAG: FGGY-family carbohydrate kinase [Christensenellaceae bacterium]